MCSGLACPAEKRVAGGAAGGGRAEVGRETFLLLLPRMLPPVSTHNESLRSCRIQALCENLRCAQHAPKLSRPHPGLALADLSVGAWPLIEIAHQLVAFRHETEQGLATVHIASAFPLFQYPRALVAF